MGISKSRIVNILSELGPQFTINELIARFNLKPSTARKYIYYMTRSNLIVRANDKYIVTDDGKNLIESVKSAKREIDEKHSYVFTDFNGNPLILRINSIEKLYGVIKYKIIPLEIIQYHIERDYLTTWISEHVGAKMLAIKLKESKNIDEIIKTLKEYLK